LYAWRQTGESRHADVVRSTLDFVLREMRAKEGGFYSALSADSHVTHTAAGHMIEGACYTWTWPQLTEALGEGDLLMHAAQRYGLSERGNAISDPLGELAGRNVLYRASDNVELAQKLGRDRKLLAIEADEIDRRLFASRKQRPGVPVDDKIVAAWNGYLITTLALAGHLLEEPRYLEAAEAAADFLLHALRDVRTGLLHRDWRLGERGVPAFSTDYAAMAEGLLVLYRVRGERRWLEEARRLADRMLEQFWDDSHGGFFLAASNPDLWLREKPASDGASLAVNSIALPVLLDLARFTGDARYRDRARRTAAWLSARLDDTPAAMPYALIRWGEFVQSGNGG
jgi:uncharacterized protein YyaL (SSP411 family)